MRRFIQGVPRHLAIATGMLAFGRRFGLAFGVFASGVACGAGGPHASSSDARWTAACPRDSSRDASGRCMCAEGSYPLLGACVPASVGDAFCGPAAQISRQGCEFRSCKGDEVIDVASGSCLARTALGRDGAAPCGDGVAPLVESERIVCVAPDATCPRGTRREGADCVNPPPCPPGALAEGSGCKAVVTTGGAAAAMRVDLGMWEALVFGIDGAPGTSDLCLPLAQRPAAFGLEHGAQTLNIRIALSAPDQDVTRVHADVVGSDAAGHPLSPLAQTLVANAVDTLVEALRSIGGVASTGGAVVRVRCGLRLP